MRHLPFAIISLVISTLLYPLHIEKEVNVNIINTVILQMPSGTIAAMERTLNLCTGDGNP